MATKTQRFSFPFASALASITSTWTSTSTLHSPPIPVQPKPYDPSQYNHLIKHYPMTTTRTYPYAPPINDPASRRRQPNILKRLSNRLQLAYYRYEVTYGIYVMTPEEKFVANSFLLVFLSLLVWALFLYFPPLLFQKLSRLVWILTGTDGVKESITVSLTLANVTGASTGICAGAGIAEAAISPTPSLPQI
ncbi:hypothetical protein PAAG_06615 [Paracoccidioides lutzii Pb01]|uniref:Uncharacterized protein n=1 Tax=Paracoccidioides lutzii (strain ATCC MYA-826 / Pb01) TaxID=502779 RepID=C1H774_PARBA|nr:hypothetical protein PAAG_06615 [Paracoccidioides lutzii Pb01]EEH35568.1 hypothetical protein PAAG_06615 [Paracoccidioides lutzii Pb01]